jgi:hypothetical protein
MFQTFTTFTVPVATARAVARSEDCRAFLWNSDLLAIEAYITDGEYADPHAFLKIVNGKVSQGDSLLITTH